VKIGNVYKHYQYQDVFKWEEFNTILGFIGVQTKHVKGSFYLSMMEDSCIQVNI